MKLLEQAVPLYIASGSCCWSWLCLHDCTLEFTPECSERAVQGCPLIDLHSTESVFAFLFVRLPIAGSWMNED
jgi:hypothetical protein